MLFSAVSLVVAAAASLVAASPTQMAPLMAHPENVIVPESYIVLFKEDVSADAAAAHHIWLSSFVSAPGAKESKYGIKRVFDYGNSVNFRGYSGRFDDEQLAAIRKNPDVAYVQQDGLVWINDVQSPAPWGLSRLTNRRGLPDDLAYDFESDAGEGVTAYIVDTGINIKHVDFEGRAFWGKTMPQNDRDEDGNGHGSHVAGTVGGKRYGVAKKVKLVAVKVLGSNGSGTISDVIGGIEFVATSHQEEVRKKGKAKSVANMSLGGGRYPLLNDAVNAAVTAGVHFAVAAGNDNRDACDYSPASAEKPITVGATNRNDERAYFSNWGRCVDIFAPGQDIESVWIGSNTATNTISGTSMASPHVAGALAAFLSRPLWGDLTPAQLKAEIVRIGGRNYISNIPYRTGTRNRLLFIPPNTTPPKVGDFATTRDE